MLSFRVVSLPEWYIRNDGLCSSAPGPCTSHRRLSGGCLLPEASPTVPDHLGEWLSSVVTVTLGLLGDVKFTGFTQ